MDFPLCSACLLDKLKVCHSWLYRVSFGGPDMDLMDFKKNLINFNGVLTFLVSSSQQLPNERVCQNIYWFNILCLPSEHVYAFAACLISFGPAAPSPPAATAPDARAMFALRTYTHGARYLTRGRSNKSSIERTECAWINGVIKF